MDESKRKSVSKWLDGVLERFFTRLAERRLKKAEKGLSPDGLIWLGFDRAALKQYFEDMPEDEQKNPCGTCGGRLD